MSGLTFRGWLSYRDTEPGPCGDLARAHRGCSFTSYQDFVRHLVVVHDEDGLVLAHARVAGKRYRRFARRRQLEGGGRR